MLYWFYGHLKVDKKIGGEGRGRGEEMRGKRRNE